MWIDHVIGETNGWNTLWFQCLIWSWTGSCSRARHHQLSPVQWIPIFSVCTICFPIFVLIWIKQLSFYLIRVDVAVGSLLITVVFGYGFVGPKAKRHLSSVKYYRSIVFETKLQPNVKYNKPGFCWLHVEMLSNCVCVCDFMRLDHHFPWASLRHLCVDALFILVRDVEMTEAWQIWLNKDTSPPVNSQGYYSTDWKSAVASSWETLTIVSQ